jgi:hypothetical protein
MLKLFKRSQNLKLILVLLVAAFLHFFVISSLNIGESVFDFPRFIEFLYSKWFLLSLFLITFLSVYYVWKTSRILFLTFLGTIFIWNFYLFFKDFNKSLMLLSFIFFVVSLYFMGILNFELEEAIYTPNFTLNDLEVRPFHSFDVWLETLSGGKIQGTLTNWDHNGCFFVPNENQIIKPQNLTLNIDFEQTRYSQKGQIVTAFGKGIGIRFNFQGESGSLFNWNDFYKILDDRSYRPKG